MNILVFHAHWNNRGDEAALRAMIDSLIDRYPCAKIKVLLCADNILQFPYSGAVSCESLEYPRKRDLYIEGIPFLLTKGAFCLSQRSKHFKQLVQDADLVIHGPGGPSIGEIYKEAEPFYLYRFLVVQALDKPYVFYAPSMGPFGKKNSIRNIIRRKVINGSKVFCLREPISAQYIAKLGNVKTPTVTLDSAFQYPIDFDANANILDSYVELKKFISSHSKIIGITITDLMWNPQYAGNTELERNIQMSFKKMIKYLIEKGYGVLFIPQLFGQANDKKYMSSFAENNSCFVMDDTYDCYFQQYIISKMYALIGMRYHSNIFSAKMGCPFLSVAYEQKMSGFMEKMQLDRYCLDIADLSFENMKKIFEDIEVNYFAYREVLQNANATLKKQAGITTEMVVDLIKNLHIC